MILSESDIRRLVGHRAFDLGRRYLRGGRVSDLVVAEGRIRAAVQGTERKPYRVEVTMSIGRRGALAFVGECTCPVGFNCKHVAAALLAAETVEEAPAPAPPPLPEPKDPPAPPAAPIASGPEPGTAGPVALSLPLQSWLGLLQDLREREREDYPEGVQQRVIYVLDVERPAAGPARLSVTVLAAHLKKDGTFSAKPRIFDLHSSYRASPARYLRASDLRILPVLAGFVSYGFGHEGRGQAVLAGSGGVTVLGEILATGRARFMGLDGPLPREAPPRAGRIGWRLLPDGAQVPDVEVEGGGIGVALAPPWWVDPEAGTLGPVETGLVPTVAALLLQAPPVPPSDAEAVRRALEERLPEARGIGPTPIAPAERIKGRPVPVLRLRLSPIPARIGGWSATTTLEMEPAARLAFRYGALEIPSGLRETRITRLEEGRLVEITRMPVVEREMAARLHGAGLLEAGRVRYPPPAAEASGDFVTGARLDESRWLAFMLETVPALRSAGWVVEADPDFPFRVVEAGGDIAAAIEERSGIDWLDLDLGVMVEGERVDLVPALVDLILQGEDPKPRPKGRPFLLRLADGRLLRIREEAIAPYVALLRDLFEAGVVDQGGGGVRLSGSAADAALLEEAAAARGLALRGAESLRAFGRMLRERGGIPAVTLPETFTATLRPYQARGVDWLSALAGAGLGGVLADDMGLGKTVQVLAHLTVEQAAGRLVRPALVVAPTSLVGTWRREAERFAPSLRVLPLHGATRRERFPEIPGHDLVITTYPLLTRDHEVLVERDWSVAVLDEAHTIKNPDATTTKHAAGIRARQRLALTGTPLENHLGELWSLFAFVAPGFLGDRTRFRQTYRTPIEKRGDAARRIGLARRIRPLILRRTKGEVASELPPKTEILETVEMEDAQRAVYESVRLAMHERVREAIAQKGLRRSSIVILDALLKMRQACCDPRLLKLKTREAARAGSAKLDRLREILPALLSEDRRILLFSQFTSMLDLIQEELRAEEIPYVLLTGDTRDRETPVQRFQEGEVPLFLISLKAGGVGLTLTAADTVIHYDPWWNPAVEDQATDRAHRIGQDKPVFVHKLIVGGSIEEKMEALKARKRSLAAGIFDPDAGGALDLTEEDVEALFAAG